MKRKLILISVVIFVALTNGLSQRVPINSFFFYNHPATNPGSYGNTDMVNINGNQKTEWINFPGRPFNYQINADVPFNLLGKKHGAGLAIVNDEIGFNKDINVRIGYAFRFQIAEGTLGAGFSIGGRQFSIDPIWEDTEEVLSANDPNIPRSGEQIDDFALGVDAGIFYRKEEMYLGLSALNVYHKEFEYYSSTGGAVTGKEVLGKHFYVTAGYNFQLSNPTYEVQPNVNLLYYGNVVTFDFNSRIIYNKKLWAGVSYRSGAAIVGMIGLQLMDGLEIGYAHDFGTNDMSRYSNGGDEFMVHYSFKIWTDKSPQRYKSIRYL